MQIERLLAFHNSLFRCYKPQQIPFTHLLNKQSSMGVKIRRVIPHDLDIKYTSHMKVAGVINEEKKKTKIFHGKTHTGKELQ